MDRLNMGQRVFFERKEREESVDYKEESLLPNLEHPFLLLRLGLREIVL